MDAKAYYEWYNRSDPSSTYRPEDETTFPQRLDWFLKNTPSESKVLDYGCGEGDLLAKMTDRTRLHSDSCGVDISENVIQKASSRFPKLKFSCLRADGGIPAPDQSFDVIVATEVVEHVFDTDGMFKEFRRVLRPSGKLLISCPYHGFLKDLALLLSGTMDRHYHDPYSSHIRYYSRATLRLVHKKHGFRLIRESGVGRLPFLWNSMVTAAVKEPS